MKNYRFCKVDYGQDDDPPQTGGAAPPPPGK